jgi:hypothetical protein
MYAAAFSTVKLLLLLSWGGIAQGIPNTVTITDLLFVPHPSSNHSWLIQHRHLVVKQEKLGEKWLWILPTKYLFHTLQGSLTSHKILWHEVDDFTFPPKEVVLWIFIALKNPLSLAGFEPTNHGYNGKDNNH